VGLMGPHNGDGLIDRYRMGEPYRGIEVYHVKMFALIRRLCFPMFLSFVLP
jgi:hypothetical protein